MVYDLAAQKAYYWHHAWQADSYVMLNCISGITGKVRPVLRLTRYR
jgi:hypothetical protein